ncbi:hypothetical protein C8A01DRAFT_35026 [Parachaetomium inaequale]|uniref:GST N-terminal domain-containing protein n=1 Tax=Parachaetomium inaequale TaxID=2588326 RepID=A0AAN6SSS9_9PEZI|nr:hypothetical protein C8A01DRAFT_35026 [Parachaetomium inaequale]
MSGQIVLFDIPSKQGTCWSLNPWKTRLLLNYKGLDYRTEWLEYPNIRPTLEPHLPNNGSSTPYTIPTILLPSGTYIMDSRAIATALEAAHPSPPLHLDSPALPRLESLLRRVMIALKPIYIVRVPKVILNEASVPFWNETRAAAQGVTSLEEYERANVDLGPRWEEAEPALREVTDLLGEAPPGKGPFFLGNVVSYADFVWAGFLIFMGRLGEDVLEEVLVRSGGGERHRALLEGLGPWVKRAGH